jgi:hypothetical protein
MSSACSYNAANPSSKGSFGELAPSTRPCTFEPDEEDEDDVPKPDEDAEQLALLGPFTIGSEDDDEDDVPAPDGKDESFALVMSAGFVSVVFVFGGTFALAMLLSMLVTFISRKLRTSHCMTDNDHSSGSHNRDIQTAASQHVTK